MVWRCFVDNKLGPIVSIDGSITGNKYVSLLQENLLSYLDALVADSITSITFQQDNVQPYICKKAQAFFKMVIAEHRFTVIDNWPSYLPNMNLLENLWAHLKLELYQQYPNTATLKGSP